MPISHRPWPLPVTSIDSFSYANITLEEALEELASRFIFNIPEWERNSMERVGFQVETAHWHYEDFVREQNPKFPTVNLKRFFGMLWTAVPLLNEWHEMHEEAFDQFCAYKAHVPVCGAIILNESCEKVVLVKGWKTSSGWGFPKGKINQNEDTMTCAVREVLEETGFDIRPYASEERSITVSIYSQQITLYIVHPVPEDTVFETRTRKEISRIEWFRLADLPGWGQTRSPAKFFLITPFMQDIRNWIVQYKRQLQLQAAREQAVQRQSTPPSKKSKKNKDKQKASRQGNRNQSLSIDAGNRCQAGGDTTSDAPWTAPDTSGDLTGETPDMTASRTASTSGDFSLAELLASTSIREERPGTAPSAARGASGHSSFGHYDSPSLTRRQPEAPSSDSPSAHRSPVRSNSRSSIVSSASTLSIHHGRKLEEDSERSRDLLDMLAGDAIQRTASLSSSEQTPRPRPVSIPSQSDISSDLLTSRSVPSHTGAALMAALQISPETSGSPSSFASTPSQPLIQGQFSSTNLSGKATSSAVSRRMETPLSNTPFGSIPMLQRGNPPRQHQPIQFNGIASFSHPVDAYPYRPSSVPLQETPMHQSHFAPMHNASGHNPYGPVNSYPILAPPNLNPAVQLPSAISGPRQVPHAHHLLSLFQEAPTEPGQCQ